MNASRRSAADAVTTQAGNSSQAVYCWVIHKLSVALTVAVFPLIWVGGLVTTYDAGMAVPDWPGTYGWNLFAYPASTWLFGPFDLLVEHSHRLLGALAGFLSIGLVIAAFLWERRPWFKIWAVFVLIAVIAQGSLGGARVLLDERTFAMIHGCTGPLFFAIATATAVMSSRWWLTTPISDRGTTNESNAESRPVGQNATSALAMYLGIFTLVTSYGQLIMGAQLRHVTGLVSHKMFKAFVHTHLALAGLLILTAVAFAFVLTFHRDTPAKVARVGQLLAFVVAGQIALGVGTWVVNYALPWPELSEALASYTISSKGFVESMIVTAHMATGSLILSLGTVGVLRAWRSRQFSPEVV